MFKGEEFVRFNSDLPRERILQVIEDSFIRLGKVTVFDRGQFEISGGKFKSFATDVKIDGRVSKGREKGEWELAVSYEVAPSAVCWVIAVVASCSC